MAAMEEGLFPSLEQAFRCHIHGVKPRRNVYFVKTNRGLWVVKGYSDRIKADWVTQLAQQLRERGFHQTVQYMSDIQGQTVFPYNGQFYTIMKAIEGREANNSSLYDVKKSATALARFHLAAQGFPTPQGLTCYRPSIMDKWETRLQQFDQIVAKLKKREPQNRIEQTIQLMVKEVKRDADQVMEQMYKIPLFSEMEQAIELGTMAHRDVASHNFLIAPTGNCFLIDLDTVDNDMQLVDLVQLMGRMLLLQEYNFDSFMEAIDAYHKVKPLSDTQIWMVFQMLRYPDNVLREVTGVYYKRPGYSARGVTELLQMERKLRHARRAFLQSEQRIFQRIGPYTYVG